jgi:hypothetical protein
MGNLQLLDHYPNVDVLGQRDNVASNDFRMDGLGLLLQKRNAPRILVMTYLTQLFIAMSPFILFTIIKGTSLERTVAIILAFCVSEIVFAESADQRDFSK